MSERSRREFLGDVGRGMLLAGVGSTVALDLGLIPAAFGAEGGGDLDLGELRSLVDRITEVPLARLQPLLVKELQGGTSPGRLIAAGALANARAFGGEDYEGYHVMMALVPAFEMSQQLAPNERALPVLKVLYRNAARMEGSGRKRKPTLRSVDPAEIPVAEAGSRLQEWGRAGNLAQAESALARLAQTDPEAAFEALQPLVHDDYEVHRVVLAWRAWDVMRLTGREHAETLLRQTVRFCVNDACPRRGGELRKLLPKIIDECRLLSKPLGDRNGSVEWIEQLANTVFSGSRADAARAAGEALSQGYSAEAVGEALSIAATRLVLHDPGRAQPASFGRGKGSVHGASVGVHASDSASAWRSIARVSSQRNTVASLIVGAYHTAGQRGHVRNEEFPYRARVSEADRKRDADGLLAALDGAIRERDQSRASALVHHYGQRGFPAEAIFRRCLGYAVSEDGALHAEKYYRTVQSEFAATRPECRWQHLVALGRVTASEYGTPAPGRDEARRLLGVAL